MGRPPESRWATLLAYGLVGIGGWMALMGADGELPPIAANGISIATVVAALAILAKYAPPVITALRPQGNVSASDRAEIMGFLDRRFDRIENVIREVGTSGKEHTEDTVGAAQVETVRRIEAMELTREKK